MSKKVMETEQLVQLVSEELTDTKGQDLKVLTLKGMVSFTDYFIIVTGTSDRHVQALADKVRLKLKNDVGLLPLAAEGFERGHWILLDYGDFVLHVFQADYREYYNLEEFWAKAPEYVPAKETSKAR